MHCQRHTCLTSFSLSSERADGEQRSKCSATRSVLLLLPLFMRTGLGSTSTRTRLVCRSRCKCSCMRSSLAAPVIRFVRGSRNGSDSWVLKWMECLSGQANSVYFVDNNRNYWSRVGLCLLGRTVEVWRTVDEYHLREGDRRVCVVTTGGLLASCCGGIFQGIVWYLATQVSPAVILIGAVSGVVGSLVRTCVHMQSIQIQSW